MRRATTGRALLAGALLAGAALASTDAAPAAPARSPLPRATTGAVTHVRGASALLTATVNPEGSETSYFFQYGPTAAYGLHTPNGSAGKGVVRVKVGQTAAPFLVGYHYRLVATNAAGTRLGHDRVYTAKSSKFKITLFKPSEPLPYGAKAVITGVAVGPAAANHRIALLESPYPYREAFTPVGLPTLTNATGHFSFRLGVLTQSTQYRVTTLDPLPHISGTLTENVAVRVIFKVRPSGRVGFVRLYGTVKPAEVGARVLFQLLKPARPGRTEKTEERTAKFHTEAISMVKRATRSFSRYSSILQIRLTGLYRVFIAVRAGPLVSGGSRAILIHGPAAHKHKR